MLFKKDFNAEKSKGIFCVQKSKEIALLIKMRSTLKVPNCITKGILAIICSNSFSHCQGDQKKTEAISQIFSNVRGWSGGAMVLGKLSVPECPTYLD